MASFAEILLFLTLCWPFLAGIALIATGRPGTDESGTDHDTVMLRLPFAVIGLLLTVLNLPLAVYMTVTGSSTAHFWLIETPVAVLGSMILYGGLLSENLALCPRTGRSLAVLERARPFWTTGLIVVAVFFADPLAKMAILLLASILRVLLIDGGQGRAVAGWTVLRTKASGALLVLAGLLCPGTSASGVLAGIGYAVLTGLFPVSAFPEEADNARLPDIRNMGETVRASAGALLLASVLSASPLPSESSAIFSLTLISFGFVTVFVTSFRMQFAGASADIRLSQGLNVSQGCLALGAIAAGLNLPMVTCFALIPPVLTLPWLARSEMTAASDLSGRLAEWTAGLLPFITVLIILYVMTTYSVILALALTIIVLPAIRRGGRDLIPLMNGIRPGAFSRSTVAQRDAPISSVPELRD
ncbi:hypothetical protein [Acetobacter fallax]|uniref:Uncharacterized protein n=1 Tax=Acetobacter fallax TaxID=1737473 RepID=A0ABX0KD72_9PROT|nr:hypothetical protein [Acetobacter fallax]NHO33081.1 hypothetical protein [Acetobacter fallax]NHO36673.1 hypothetical protein [Acetobacter fallax]